MAMRMMNSLQLAPYASLPVLAPLTKTRRSIPHGHLLWRSRIRLPAAPESGNLFTIHMSYRDSKMRASSSGHGGRKRGNFSNSNSTCNSLPRAQVPASAQDPSHAQEEKTKDWEEWLAVATSLYPVYMVVGGVVAFWRPSTFAWFVKCGPNSYSAALSIIMLAMGFTLRLQDLFHVLTHQSIGVIFGFIAQYTIMPLLGAGLSHAFGLPAEISAGLILLACCPGGTASNVVTYIARGDVPLSILMTICTTFAAVFTTPLLTSVLAGAYVPVDALGLASSTLLVVLAPVLVGAWMQTCFPNVVATITHVAPLIAVLISSLLASSVFSANVPLLVDSVKMGPNIASSVTAPSVLVNLGVIASSVMMLHAAGFLLGYITAALVGFKESQRRAISIEVGMQNSSLGVVLATMHFASPLTAVPAAVSAVLMNIMGSGLAVVWRNIYSNDAGGTDQVEVKPDDLS